MTVLDPAVCTADAGTVAVSCVEETKVVVRFEPFQRTSEPETNPEPVTVRLKAGLPTAALPGLMAVMMGSATTVNVTLLEPRPPEFSTDTGTLPGLLICVDATDAVSCVAET